MRCELRFAVLLCFALALFGCSVDLKTAVVGRYHGEADISGVKPEMREMAEKGATLVGGWLLEIKKSGKATLTGMGGKATRGQWKLEDGTLVVMPDGEAKEITFSIEDGGKKLVPLLAEDEKNFLQGAKVWFKKE